MSTEKDAPATGAQPDTIKARAAAWREKLTTPGTTSISVEAALGLLRDLEAALTPPAAQGEPVCYSNRAVDMKYAEQLVSILFRVLWEAHKQFGEANEDEHLTRLITRQMIESALNDVQMGRYAAPSPSSTEKALVEALRPEVVCLCGSTRFFTEFQVANYDLTMQGKIVLSVGFHPHATEHGEAVGLTNAGYPASKKEELDELHKRKIDLADRVFVLNVGGYIGDSTRSEIEYAMRHGKPVDYLEPALAAYDAEVRNG